MKWRTAAGLAFVIVVLMVANSRGFFFHQPFYEVDDWAADSLAIDKAKHFAAVYGNYSRWGFRHPGPVFFYVQAFGEWLLYDKLHWVAAPFNGQVFAQLIVLTCFFVAALMVVSQWLPERGRQWFLPIALAFSAVHFASMANLSVDLTYTLRAPSALASPWSAHALLMPTLCLLAAGASVAAGRGRYLPLIALADGCLVHSHVAQPLFVVPLSLLAYGGLCWQGWKRGRVPWREFPLAHLATGGITLLFLLPVLLDLRLGKHSNLAQILDHMHKHHEEHKTLARSLLYFLQFGTYTAYYPLPLNEFGWYDWPGMARYLLGNTLFWLFWASVTILALRPLVASLRRRPEPAAAAPETRRFLAWGGVFIVADFLLTLFWGTIQDGPMVYFNSWFNYSIYQFIFLLAVATLCARPEFAGPPLRPAWRVGAVAGVALVWGYLAGPLRVEDTVPEADVAIRKAVAEAMVAANPPGVPAVPNLLVFSQDMWQVAAGVALQLERAHQPYLVLPQWDMVFSKDHLWRTDSEKGAPPVNIFHFLLSGTKTAVKPAFALWKRGFLTITPPAIDPNSGSSNIDFRVHGNSADLKLFGLSPAEDWGTWSDSGYAALGFHPLPTARGGDVVLTMDIHPLLRPDKGVDRQRLRVAFNGQPLGEHSVTAVSHATTFVIPGALWDRAAAQPKARMSTLAFDLPDAVKLGELYKDPRTLRELDSRQLAIGFHQLQFRERDPNYQPPDAPTVEPGGETATIDFSVGGNAAAYQVSGWNGAEPWGAWSNGHHAALAFYPRRVPGDGEVEIVLEIHPFTEPGKGLQSQRLRALFNGKPLGDEVLIAGGEIRQVVFRVPGWRWQQAGERPPSETIPLAFDLPDAVTPASLHPENPDADPRQLSIGFSRIQFRRVPAADGR